MEPRPLNDRGRKRWLNPTVLVLGSAPATLLLLSAAAAYSFRETPTALRFFDPRRSPTSDESWVVSTMDYALSSTEKNDVVFLGDSVCRTTIDPIRLESLSGLHGYNLGVAGHLGPEVVLNLAQAYLASHPPPRLMVLCVSPVGLEQDVPTHWEKLRDHVLNCYGFEARSAKSIAGRLGYRIRQGTVIAWNESAGLLCGQRRDVRDMPLDGKGKETYRTFEQSTRKSRGYVVLSGKGLARDLDRPGGIVAIHDAWDSNVRRLAKICEQARVPVLIRFGPISAESSKNLKFDRLERWLHDLQESHSNVRLPRDRRILRYPPELCWDSTHCIAAGAAKFTAQLSEDVRSALTSAGDAQEK